MEKIGYIIYYVEYNYQLVDVYKPKKGSGKSREQSINSLESIYSTKEIFI